MSFIQWGNLNLVPKSDSSEFGVRLHACDSTNEDLFRIKAAESDSGSKVHAHIRKLTSNEYKMRVNFISPKMLNMINLHKALNISWKTV